MATTNQLNAGLSGTNGTGSYAGTTSPVFVTPTLGAASATSLNFGASATNGIIGVTGASSAASGVVGEVISAVVLSASKISLISATAANITSITLTAGDWNVFGSVEISGTATAMSSATGAISLTSATTPLSTDINGAIEEDPYTGAPGAIGERVLSPGPAIINVSTNTTVYLVVFVGFSGGTGTAWGKIVARRVR